jgi:segregation and condensation protein B
MPTEKQPKPRRPRRKNADSPAATTVSEQELVDTFEAEELVADSAPADIAAGEHEGANPDAALLIAELRSMGREEETIAPTAPAESGEEEAHDLSLSHTELEAELDASGLEVVGEEFEGIDPAPAAAIATAESEEEYGTEEGVTFLPEEIEAAEDIELVPSTNEETDALEAYYADDGDEGVSEAVAPAAENAVGLVSEADVLASEEVAASEGDFTPVEEVPGAVSEAEVLAHQEAVAEGTGAAPNFGAHDHGIDGDFLATGEGESEEETTEPMPAFRSLAGGDLMAAVEATFFMHHKPIGISKLRELINPKIDEEEYRSAVSNLMATYFDESRGIELAEVAGGYQFRTKALHKDIMRRMYQIAPMKLTNAMLEVLAISAYNQPITRETIDRIRGVDSSHLVRVLLDKKMLRIVGKSDELGRPMLYGTTKEFLEVFGLRDLSSLPSLRELEDMLPKNEVGVEISEEDMLAKEMEGIVENAKPLEFNDLEMDELEANETQKVQNTDDASPEAHGHGRTPRDGSAESGEEAGGEGFHLPSEIAGRLPFGPEGNA